MQVLSFLWTWGLSWKIANFVDGLITIIVIAFAVIGFISTIKWIVTRKK